jgi:hypothetical protein
VDGRQVVEVETGRAPPQGYHYITTNTAARV